MSSITNELKTKLLAAQSGGEAAAILKAAGQEITPEDAARLMGEIEKRYEPEGRELSLDELEAVSGGSEERDWALFGCDSTVEINSWCGSHDACIVWSVEYIHEPRKGRCPNCNNDNNYLYIAATTPAHTIYRCRFCDYQMSEWNT